MSNARTPLPIWPAGQAGIPPADEAPPEIERGPIATFDIATVRNIVRPTLTPYLPEPGAATGTAVVVCPGGAFHFLAIEHEGTLVARWLNECGVAALILRYRTIATPESDDEFLRQMRENRSGEGWRERMREASALAVADGLQAMRVARSQAASWGFAPEKVGILGFSAGGVVATGVAAGYDAESRPAFAAPIYTAPYAIEGVPADAPPLFLALAADDAMAVGSSLPLFSAWREAGRQAELHVYGRGGHGFGMLHKGLPSDGWIEQFGAWMRAEGF